MSMVIKYLRPALIVFFVVIVPAHSQELSHLPGAFVNIGIAARPTALGGAYIGLVDDANALLWNPAGLARLKHQQISFSHTKQFGLIPYYYAAYARQTNTSFSHSEAVLLSGDAALQEIILMVGASYRLSNFLKGLSVGATFKYKNASFGRNSDGGEGAVEGTANGLGVDMGTLYELQEDVVVAVVMRNVFDYVKWNSSALGSYSQGNPLELVLGLAIRDLESFNLAIDFEKSLHLDTSDRLRFGLERSLYDLVVLRGGVFQDTDGDAARNYTVGAGVVYQAKQNNTILFDAAYSLQSLGNSLRVSLAVSF